MTWNPYFRLIAAATHTASSPLTTSAVADIAVDPASVRPRASHACNVTRGSLRNRFAFPLLPSVVNPNRPSSTAAIHTGVATGWPLRRIVVHNTYFSSAMPTGRA